LSRHRPVSWPLGRFGPQAECKRLGGRYQGEKRTLIDGPFAEGKEMVGGFYLLDCADREEATAAQQCPVARFATVEKRLGHRGATTVFLSSFLYPCVTRAAPWVWP